MPRKTTPKLSEALTKYLALRRQHMAASSVHNDQSVLRRFVAGVGDRQVHTLTADTCEDWFALEAERQQASSYNKVLQRSRLFLSFCTRRGWLDTDPLAELRLRKVVKRERLRLNGHQLVELVEGCPNPRNRGVLACGRHGAVLLRHRQPAGR